jgi:hypothetical protein
VLEFDCNHVECRCQSFHLRQVDRPRTAFTKQCNFFRHVIRYLVFFSRLRRCTVTVLQRRANAERRSGDCSKVVCIFDVVRSTASEGACTDGTNRSATVIWRTDMCATNNKFMYVRRTFSHLFPVATNSDAAMN